MYVDYCNLLFEWHPHQRRTLVATEGGGQELRVCRCRITEARDCTELGGSGGRRVDSEEGRG